VSPLPVTEQERAGHEAPAANRHSLPAATASNVPAQKAGTGTRRPTVLFVWGWRLFSVVGENSEKLVAESADIHKEREKINFRQYLLVCWIERIASIRLA
jgi:hypothetical protein